jgi:hypothetical protein
MPETSLDFTQALEALGQITDNFTVNAWVPSLNQEITFKQLDAKQQKELLSSAMDTSVYNTSFIKTFYNILKENIIDKNVNVNEFNLVDKLSVGLALKSKLSTQITLFFGEDKKTNIKVDVNDIIEKLKQYKSPSLCILESKISNFSLKVELKYVTIQTEYQYDTQYKNNKKTEDLKNTEDIQKIISEAFLRETSKYINKIWINENSLDLTALNLDQKIKLIEKFPSSFVQKIIEKIGDWKTEIDDVLSVKHDNETQIISLEPSFFLT